MRIADEIEAHLRANPFDTLPKVRAALGRGNHNAFAAARRRLGLNTVAGKLRLGVKRSDSGCLEWQGPRKAGGYGRIKVNGKNVLVHRLAWEEPNGAIPADMLVLHSCDNPPCCALEHLRVGDHADNARDKVMRGRSARVAGEANPNAKLTEANVANIRRALADGDTVASLARAFGVSRPTISYIRDGKTWRSLCA